MNRLLSNRKKKCQACTFLHSKFLHAVSIRVWLLIVISCAILQGAGLQAAEGVRSSDYRKIFLDSLGTVDLAGMTSNSMVAITYLQNARNHFTNGYIDEAEEIAKTAVRVAPCLSSAWLFLATVQEQRDESASVIHNASEAIRLGETNLWSLILRGHAYELSGNFQEAVTDYTKALNLMPLNSTACFLRSFRASCYIGLGKFDLAKEDCDIGINNGCDVPLLWFNRARSSEGLHRYAEAIRDYEAYMHLRPEDTSGPLFLAVLLTTCADEKYQDGARAFNLLLEVQRQLTNASVDEQVELLELMAQAATVAGEFTEAIGLYDKLIVLNPKDDRAVHYRESIDKIKTVR